MRPPQYTLEHANEMRRRFGRVQRVGREHQIERTARAQQREQRLIGPIARDKVGFGGGILRQPLCKQGGRTADSEIVALGAN